MHANIGVGIGATAFDRGPHIVQMGKDLIAILIGQLLDRPADGGDFEQASGFSQVFDGKGPDEKIGREMPEIRLDFKGADEPPDALAGFDPAQCFPNKRAPDAHLGGEPRLGGEPVSRLQVVLDDVFLQARVHFGYQRNRLDRPDTILRDIRIRLSRCAYTSAQDIPRETICKMSYLQF